FVPLRLDDAPIDDVVKQFAYVDWRKRSDEQYQKLLRVCRGKSAVTEAGIEKNAERFPSYILGAHRFGVFCVAMTPDCPRVVSGSRDRTLRVWEFDSRKCVTTLTGYSEMAFGVAVTPDGRRAVSGAHDGTIRVWDLNTGECLTAMEGHAKSVYGVAVAPDG